MFYKNILEFSLKTIQNFQILKKFQIELSKRHLLQNLSHLTFPEFPQEISNDER
jgi:hypothetical protein